MSEGAASSRPPFDPVIQAIAEYAVGPADFSDEAYETARLCLLDSIGCALLALNYPACAKLLGPELTGQSSPGGARVPGTSFVLPPTKAAFDIGAAIRWLDYNDTWLAAEWGHPSDNFGTILALADWLGDARPAILSLSKDERTDREPAVITVRDLLGWAIKAYEIQGVLALDNAFNRVGIDHVLLVKVASTAVATAMLGGTVEQVCNAVSNAWLEATLRTYRHAPNTGSRKSWAAGDACSRAVRLAHMAMAGEMGYPAALTAKNWGFQDAWFGGKEVSLARPLGSYVMENVLFKISFPAEFHAQTAVEATLQLHESVKDRLDEIERVEITTQEPAIRIIDKSGPLSNPADRDHCIQYMVAVPLIHGRLTADDYEDEAASDLRIDELRAKTECIEDPRYTREYLEADKRSIANAVQVFFSDGSCTDKVAVEYPIGHRRRRTEGVPLLMDKYRSNLASRFDADRAETIYEATAGGAKALVEMPAQEFMGLLVL